MDIHVSWDCPLLCNLIQLLRLLFVWKATYTGSNIVSNKVSLGIKMS